MASARFVRALVMGLLFCMGCGSLPEYRVDALSRVSEKKERVGKEAQELKSSSLEEAVAAEEHPPPVPSMIVDDEPLAAVETFSPQSPPDPESVGASPSEQNNKTSSQDLLDAALALCEQANALWERGDLDAAVDALDGAYAAIIKVKNEEDPDFLQQKEDIRCAISKRITAIYASRYTVTNGGPHEAIPLVMNDHVRRAVALFKGPNRDFFLSSYRRSGKYRPAIVELLKEAGLPEELSWLPLIESGFKVRALSRARALGIWQFIASTGYRYGLKRDHWIDERMDPVKSTEAAIAYLKELHQIFGDWTTVLAAYNCGEWAVLKQIKTQKISYLDNFWDLYEKLPRETAFYVPMFMAVLQILNDPEGHGMALPSLDEPVETEQVTVSKQIHLKRIAECLDLEFDTLKDLNAELRRDLTPDNPYDLKVPLGKGEMLLAKLEDMPAWRAPVPSHYVHRVRKGDNLSLLAQKYGTSVKAIVAMNNLPRSDYLKVGRTLRIPTRSATLDQSEKPSIPSAKLERELQSYVVRRGDSLWKIAGTFETTTGAIRSVNQLKSGRLRVGQVLRVPVGLKPSKPESTEVYHVKEGDSLYLVAKRHQMDLRELLELNNLTPRSTIFPGQSLVVRAE